MSGRRIMKISLCVVTDLIRGNAQRLHTNDVPKDARVLAVYQADEDVARDAVTVLIESDEWVSLPVGAMPPIVIPVYSKQVPA